MNKNQKNKANSKEVKNMKKAKGFTLIELIAVIAILGILAVVLVPNILGYTNKAKISKVQSDAGIIVRAIDTYEAETANADITKVLVSSNDASATKKESVMTLAELFKADTAAVSPTHTSANLIFGDGAAAGIEAPVKALPGEFFAAGVNNATDKIADMTIAQLRDISTRKITVTINNSTGGSVKDVDGTLLSWAVSR